MCFGLRTAGRVACGAFTDCCDNISPETKQAVVCSTAAFLALAGLTTLLVVGSYYGGRALKNKGVRLVQEGKTFWGNYIYREGLNFQISGILLGSMSGITALVLPPIMFVQIKSNRRYSY